MGRLRAAASRRLNRLRSAPWPSRQRARTSARTAVPGSIAVTAPAGCEWTPTVDRPWIGLAAGAAASGNGLVTYSVAANGGEAPRSGTVTIAGLAYAVSQRGRPPTVCRLELSATSASYGKDAAEGSFDVTVAAGCSWTAVSSAPWLVVTGGGQRSGTGPVSYTVARNVDAAARTATITVADRSLHRDAVGRRRRLRVLGRRRFN